MKLDPALVGLEDSMGVAYAVVFWIAIAF